MQRQRSQASLVRGGKLDTGRSRDKILILSLSTPLIYYKLIMRFCNRRSANKTCNWYNFRYNNPTLTIEMIKELLKNYGEKFVLFKS